jgi:hypothetical protein
VELDLPKAKRPTGGGGGPSGELRDYWGDSFDGALVTIGASYLDVIGTPRLEGVAADHRRGWDFRVRGFTRPHIQLGLDYSRQLWRVPNSPRRTKVNVNHLEFVFGVDVFPLPYEWKVRPALVPYGAVGLAWGRNRDTPPDDTGFRDDDLLGGFGATFGTDFIVFINPRGRVLVGLRGGISKPYYRLRAGGDRLPYDTDFPRALRWQVGIDIGATP